MKTKLTLLLMIITSSVLFAQNRVNKKVYLKFEDRVNFYAVDDRYNLKLDTIYYANEGFRVFPGYDTIKQDNGEEYVIFEYPTWRKKYRCNKPTIIQQEQYIEDYSTRPVHVDIAGKNGLTIAIPKSEFNKLKEKEKIIELYSLKPWRVGELTSGFMTIPFKFRPAQDSVNFNITTDVTMGAYIGFKTRLTRQGNNFLVIPGTLGLSYINVGNNEISKVNTENNSSIVPGWSWSTGLVLDLNGINFGIVLGKDYASSVGNDWLYNKKLWWSFSIGHTFFN